MIDVEPWRATPFPIIKDLVVDRGGFDRIIAAGGCISAPIGAAPDAQAVQVPKTRADVAFDAACPNGSAAAPKSANVPRCAPRVFNWA